MIFNFYRLDWMCRRKVRWYHRRELKNPATFVVGGPDLTAVRPDRSPSTCAEVCLRHAFAFFFTTVVPLLHYLSFCNCVPDPDMSINKRGSPSSQPDPSHVYVRAHVGGGHLDRWACPRRLFAALRWNQDVPPSSSVCLMDRRGL